jgi:hypothetical protein
MNKTYNRILDLVVNEGSGSAKSLVRRGLGGTLRANLRGAPGGGEDRYGAIRYGDADPDNDTVRYNRDSTSGANSDTDELAEKPLQSVRHKFLVNKREKAKVARAKQVAKMTGGKMEQRPSTV